MSPNRRTLAWSLAGAAFNALTALGTFCCWAAYASGDPSGVQYMFLYIGAYIAAAAGAGVVALRLFGAVPAVNLLMPALTLVVCFFPHLTGPGYGGPDLDRIGQNAAIGVLSIQVVMAAYALWWLWRGTSRRAPEERAA